MAGREYVNDSLIKKYLTENMENIIQKIESVFNYNNINIRDIPIVLGQIPDADGYPNVQSPKLGRYDFDEYKITFNPQGMDKKVFVLNKSICGDNIYMFFDLTVIHEFMHVYQDKIEHKTMEHGKKSLEEDANAKALRVFTEAYPADTKIKKKIFDYFIEISEHKLPDGVTTDCLLQ